MITQSAELPIGSLIEGVEMVTHEQLRQAVAAERERCAKIAERSARSASYDEKLCAQHIASQIRGS